jgi:hypothetical protein
VGEEALGTDVFSSIHTSALCAPFHPQTISMLCLLLSIHVAGPAWHPATYRKLVDQSNKSLLSYMLAGASTRQALAPAIASADADNLGTSTDHTIE